MFSSSLTRRRSPSGSGAYNQQNGVGYNANNPQNPTQSLGMSQPNNGIVPGFPPEPVWPCVGEYAHVPDYISLFPQSTQVAPFAGATRHLCDRKEVTLNDQQGAIAKFYLFTSTHKASKFTGVITDDFTSEFDPFSPQFGEKFCSARTMPISVEDWTGAEIGRVYSDWWGDFDGLVYSTWEVNPPNPTGYSPNMMVMCMNEQGERTRCAHRSVVQPGIQRLLLRTAVYARSDRLPGYAGGPHRRPSLPGITIPIAPIPTCTPAIAEVDGDKGKGPWASAPGVTMTLTALGNDVREQLRIFRTAGERGAVQPEDGYSALRVWRSVLEPGSGQRHLQHAVQRDHRRRSGAHH